KVLGTQNVVISSDDYFATFTFHTSSSQKGIQQYTVEVVGLSDEHTLENNVQKVYVDVIDGRERILLLALTPHPDIKALRALVEKNENYELDVIIFSSDGVPSDLEKIYDLVILHQLPDVGGHGSELLKKVMS